MKRLFRKLIKSDEDKIIERLLNLERGMYALSGAVMQLENLFKRFEQLENEVNRFIHPTQRNKLGE